MLQAGRACVLFLVLVAFPSITSAARHLSQIKGPAANPDTCWFCNDADFTGGCLERRVGEYPDLFPYHNDWYRSIRCGENVYAEVWSATGFRADYARIINDEADLKPSGLNNHISSLKVVKRPEGSVAGIRYNGSYRGVPYIKSFGLVPPGAHDLGDLRQYGLGEDRPIDEIHVPTGVKVELRSAADSIASERSSGILWGQRLFLGPGTHRLKDYSFTENKGACPPGGVTDSAGNCLTRRLPVTTTWDRATLGMIVTSA